MMPAGTGQRGRRLNYNNNTISSLARPISATVADCCVCQARQAECGGENIFTWCGGDDEFKDVPVERAALVSYCCTTVAIGVAVG